MTTALENYNCCLAFLKVKRKKHIYFSLIEFTKVTVCQKAIFRTY